jgi:TfoX/Sxy family transcriptional regulator of competence genes
MPYNTDLENLVEDILSNDILEKKKMFGGVCYLINGNMAFGIWKDYLIVRMAAELTDEKLNHEHVREFDITGKTMKGWVMIKEGSWNKQAELAEWLAIGKSFAVSLPKKIAKKKSLEEIYYRTNP